MDFLSYKGGLSFLGRRARVDFLSSKGGLSFLCRRARVILLGPLTPDDVDAASFMEHDSEFHACLRCNFTRMHTHVLLRSCKCFTQSVSWS